MSASTCADGRWRGARRAWSREPHLVIGFAIARLVAVPAVARSIASVCASVAQATESGRPREEPAAAGSAPCSRRGRRRQRPRGRTLRAPGGGSLRIGGPLEHDSRRRRRARTPPREQLLESAPITSQPISSSRRRGSPRPRPGESKLMLDTHAVARSLTAADFTPAQADAVTDALRLVVEQGEHVTSDQFKAGMAEMRTRVAPPQDRGRGSRVGVDHGGALGRWRGGEVAAGGGETQASSRSRTLSSSWPPTSRTSRSCDPRCRPGARVDTVGVGLHSPRCGWRNAIASEIRAGHQSVECLPREHLPVGREQQLLHVFTPDAEPPGRRCQMGVEPMSRPALSVSGSRRWADRPSKMLRIAAFASSVVASTQIVFPSLVSGSHPQGVRRSPQAAQQPHWWSSPTQLHKPPPGLGRIPANVW